MTINAIYEIRIFGELPEHWFDWFDNFTVTSDEEGITNLKGYVADQSALYGVIARLGQLNLKIISILQTDLKFGEEE